MRFTACLALTAAVILLVPVHAIGAEPLSPAAARGLADLAQAKAVYTPTVTAWPTASGITVGQALANSTLTGGTASVEGTFAFTDPSIVPGVGMYEASVTFTPTDTATYTTVVATVSVAVSAAAPVEPTIAPWPTASPINYGQKLEASTLTGGAAFVDETAVPGTFAFVTPATVPSAGIYQASVIFTPTDTERYTKVTGTVSVTVNMVTPTVSSWPTAGTITYGQALSSSTLTGGAGSVSGRFTFVAPNTEPDAGVYVADVVFTPTDTANYNTVTGTVSVTVETAAPDVTAWPAASAITEGETLASSNLSGGAAAVPGNFAFTAPDTVPPVGAYTADITFTPSDTANYRTVQGTAPVTVEAAPEVYTLRDYLGIPLLALVGLGIVRLAEWDRVGGPCFIATAAWGTPLAPEIDRLREFRDNTLLTGALGIAAVDVYYRVSPAIADAVAASPALAMLVRIALIPVLVLVSLPAPLVTGLGVVAAVLLARRVIRRRRAGRESAE